MIVANCNSMILPGDFFHYAAKIPIKVYDRWVNALRFLIPSSTINVNSVSVQNNTLITKTLYTNSTTSATLITF